MSFRRRGDKIANPREQASLLPGEQGDRPELRVRSITWRGKLFAVVVNYDQCFRSARFGGCPSLGDVAIKSNGPVMDGMRPVCHVRFSFFGLLPYGRARKRVGGQRRGFGRGKDAWWVKEGEPTHMEIVGLGLIAVGGFLLYTWFGRRRMMIRQGTWEEQGGAGGYMWLAIYLGLILVGLALVGTTDGVRELYV